MKEKIEALKVAHYECEDSWYSCPKSEAGTLRDGLTECECISEDHNKRVDEILELLNL